jgi:hypothetical protein
MGDRMTIHYDEKGKYYTDVVATNAVEATIQTSTHLLRGYVHPRSGERLKDELDRAGMFLAVTDAVVLGAGGEELYRAEFLAVSRSQIVWVIENDSGKAGEV